MKSLFKNFLIVILLIGTSIYLTSCKEEATPPVVTTTVISDITFTSASTGGVVKDEGGAEVTAMGVCWSTRFPTIIDTKTIEGAGAGSFTSIITGLLPGTVYYVRAYAVNSAGTAYGNMQMFTTSIQTVGTEKADFPGGERSGAVSFAVGTKVYSGLGWLGNNGGSTGVRDFWEWDQATNIWTKKADYPGNSVSGAVGFSIGLKGYIGTGYSITGDYTNDFWEYDPATNIWTDKASLPLNAARGNAGFSIGTKGYIGTGFFSDGESPSELYQDFWEWDQATNVWTKKANFGGSGRSGAVGFSIGNKGYIATGSDSHGFLQDIWEWDQATNVWLKIALLAGTARVSAFGVSIGDKGYIGTGYIEGFDWGGALNDFWEFDPNLK